MTWRSPGFPEAVEVLPRAEFDDEHLPGAISLPLKSLTTGTSAVLGNLTAT
jgi:hypothetical protein